MVASSGLVQSGVEGLNAYLKVQLAHVKLLFNYSIAALTSTLKKNKKEEKSEMEPRDIYSRVGERYSAAARSSDNNYGATVAKAFGYSEQELSSIPIGANLGLCCGNPLAIAALKEVRCTKNSTLQRNLRLNTSI